MPKQTDNKKDYTGFDYIYRHFSDPKAGLEVNIKLTWVKNIYKIKSPKDDIWECNGDCSYSPWSYSAGPRLIKQIQENLKQTPII